MSVVVKKELLRIPVFGRGLRLLEPIVLDRHKAHGALKSLISDARKRLQVKRWVLIFPEGTRVAPGRKFAFKQGAAQVALASGSPVLPIAHNAGACWGGQKLAVEARHGDILYRSVSSSNGSEHKRVNSRR